MNWKLFRELSDAKATILDLCWLVLAISYAFGKYQTFDIISGLLGLVAIVFFHLIINFHNNYNEFKTYRTGSYHDKINKMNINRESLAKVRRLVYAIGIIPILITAYLTYRTGWFILLVAIIGLILGFLYTSGPRPLNSTIMGEAVIAIAISVVIPVAFVYLGLATAGKIDSSTIIDTIVICLPITFAIFGTIIANNVMDLEDDLKNDRHTLVDRIGKHNSMNLFKASWALTYALIPILALMKVIPYVSLIMIIFYPGIWDIYRPFLSTSEPKNFPNVLKATLRLTISYIGLMAVGAIIDEIIILIK
ncbi:prenyltransferase [Companilactobacillus mishanensis]|uniref:prenyltransferase n=1 Tax=Companilactobacillus mishanensis TaxID=2486008 RepID=UPI00129779EB|nr:prenyltransferase [Companilactobacillus mishanensis]